MTDGHSNSAAEEETKDPFTVVDSQVRAIRHTEHQPQEEKWDNVFKVVLVHPGKKNHKIKIDDTGLVWIPNIE